MASALESSSGIDAWRKRLGIPLTVIVFLALYFMPLPQGLTPAGQKSIALLASLVTLYLTEPVELTVASLFVIPMAVFMGLGQVKDVLQSFATPAIFLLVGATMLGAAMEKTRLAERFTYWMLSTIGVSAARITLGVTLSNVALAFMVPSSTARVAIMLPICLSIIHIYNKETHQDARSNFAVGLLLTLAFTNSTISSGIMTATIPNPITVDFIHKASGVTITYMAWLKYGFPPAIIMTFFTSWYLQKAFKAETQEIPGGVEHIREKLKAMGSITWPEWRTLVVFLLVVTLWATGGITKIDTTVACYVGISLLFLPKVGVLKWKDTNRDSAYHILILSGGSLAVGEFLLKTGAAKWLATKIFASLGLVGVSAFVVLLVVLFIVQFSRIGFMGTTGLTVLFMPVIVSLAAVAHMPAAALALPAGMVIGGFPFLMFYNTLGNILVFGTGYLKVGDFPKVGGVLCLVGVLLYTLCAGTYWKWLGLF